MVYQNGCNEPSRPQAPWQGDVAAYIVTFSWTPGTPRCKEANWGVKGHLEANEGTPAKSQHRAQACDPSVPVDSPCGSDSMDKARQVSQMSHEKESIMAASL